MRRGVVMIGQLELIVAGRDVLPGGQIDDRYVGAGNHFVSILGKTEMVRNIYKFI